jgi:hypothetical protein
VLRNKAPVASLLLLAASAHAALVADVYIDMNGSPVGTALSPAVMAAGTHGAGIGSWSVLGGAAGMTVGPSDPGRKLFDAVTVGGTTYPVSHPSQSIAYDNAFNFSSVVVEIPSGHPAVTASGYLTLGPTGASSGSILDLVRIDNLNGDCAVLQMENYLKDTINVETVFGGTKHSAYLDVTAGATYWYTFKADSVAGRATLNLYDASGNLVGSVNNSFEKGVNVSAIRYGNEEVAKSSGHMTYFENIVIDYSNAVFPIVPSVIGKCDLNKDSVTNVSDVQLCVNQAIGMSTCVSGDINGDGSCNVLDVQRTVNAALGGQCVTQ